MRVPCMNLVSILVLACELCAGADPDTTVPARPASTPVRLPPVDASITDDPADGAWVADVTTDGKSDERMSSLLDQDGAVATQPDSAATTKPDNTVSLAEVKKLIDERAWKKGAFTITPSGAFWGDMVYATHRTSPGPYTLYVLSQQDNGEDAFVLDVRRSRFALDVAGPAALLEEGRSGGKVEIDFLGNFVTENRAAVQLRHVYWEEKNSDFRLLVGQTWDVISPLSPGMLDAAGGFYGGVIGFRRAQFRVERFVSLDETLQVALQGSLNQDIIADFPTDPGVRREPGDWPVVQGRVALQSKTWTRGGQPAGLGFSGHIGEVGFDFIDAGPPPLNLPPANDTRFETWSANVDLFLPISDRFGFQAEYFTGSNLSSFLGGIGQGVCPCARVPIRSHGGWCDFWFDWTPCLHSRVGAGFDDPDNRDFMFGRTYNQFLFANLSLDVTKHLVVGIEIAYWRTLYQENRVGLIPADELTPSQPGEAIVVDWMMKYAF